MEELLFAFGWSFVLSYLLLYVYIRIAHKKGWLAKDVHKSQEVYVADRGGLILFLIPLLSVPLLYYEFLYEYVAFVCSIILGLLVGLVDDLKDLGLKKAIFVMISALPILLVSHLVESGYGLLYNPRPYIPFIGFTRMYLVYPLFIMALYSVMADACNMIDIYNGTLLYQGLAVLFPLFIIAIMGMHTMSIILIAIGLGYTLGFLYWNKYPARVFHGNVGAYGYGVMLSSIMILSAKELIGVEFIAIIGFLPAIFNGFIYVFNTRFAPKSAVSRQLKSNFVENGVLKPNLNPDAAIDLSRLILLHGEMTEKELISMYLILFTISAVLALLTGVMIVHGYMEL